MGTDLASKSTIEDTDYIKGGLSSWSWVLLKDDFTDYNTSMKFIDYAADMNWRYCLIDADWDKKIGYERMKELVDYAKNKGIGIVLWYNSSGDWNGTTYSPKSKLITREGRENEFSLLKSMGVAGCKIDFFGGDGQSMINYYHDILEDAAKYELLINFNGDTITRGWQRTYTNLMTMEAIKGEEFITFEQVNADEQPAHCCVIPFTRNVFDPMDFTPMVLDSIPNIKRKTTTTFELALPVLFTSGIQHIAEIPEGMDKMPEFVKKYLQGLPTLWDDTKFISGFPGKDVVLARRLGSHWYVVGINGEEVAKEIELDIPYIENKNGYLIKDSEGKIPEKQELDAIPKKIQIQPYGGFVLVF
ncbi:MAG: glycoside hydrolase family 97 catalytic domain-containing protein [Saprospiraceae bacterium]